MLWRLRSRSHFYVLRCRACQRQSRVATIDFEELDEKWNDTVRALKEGTKP